MGIYESRRYLGQERLQAYLEQMKYVHQGERILEIGGGARVFSYMASKVGSCVVVDIDPSTQPDFIVDVLDPDALKEVAGNIDVAFCCQVLEHIPFSEFGRALKNIANLNPKTICLSIPDNRRSLRLSLRFNRFDWAGVFSIPFTGYHRDLSNHPSHHWELYWKNKSKVFDVIRSVDGYVLRRDYRLFDRAYQHFFILERLGCG